MFVVFVLASSSSLSSSSFVDRSAEAEAEAEDDEAEEEEEAEAAANISALRPRRSTTSLPRRALRLPLQLLSKLRLLLPSSIEKVTG